MMMDDRILIPEECVTCRPWDEAYKELRQYLIKEGGRSWIWWWAHEARNRELPAMLCNARAEDEFLLIKALQPADCFPDAAEGNRIPGMSRPFPRELDKEMYLRLTDLLHEIKELAQPEALGSSHYPDSDYSGLEMVEIPDDIRLELIQSESLANFHERLIPLLKQEVERLHNTEYLIGLLRGDVYLRPDAE